MRRLLTLCLVASFLLGVSVGQTTEKNKPSIRQYIATL